MRLLLQFWSCKRLNFLSNSRCWKWPKWLFFLYIAEPESIRILGQAASWGTVPRIYLQHRIKQREEITDIDQRIELCFLKHIYWGAVILYIYICYRLMQNAHEHTRPPLTHTYNQFPVDIVIMFLTRQQYNIYWYIHILIIYCTSELLSACFGFFQVLRMKFYIIKDRPSHFKKYNMALFSLIMFRLLCI